MHLNDQQMQEAVDLVATAGGVRPAARDSGIGRTTLQYRYNMALERGFEPTGDDPRLANHSPDILQRLDELGIPADQLRNYWIKDKRGSYHVKAPQPEMDAESIMQPILAAASLLEGRGGTVTGVEPAKGEHALVLAPADIHFGKLSAAIETGDEYNIKIAEQRTKDGVLAVLRMASGFGVERIVVNTGNDSMHTENGKTTTSGTPQDVDGTWHQQWDAAFMSWIWVIEEAARHAPVTVVFDASNHPWRSDWSVNRALESWFRNDDRVTFPQIMQTPRHRKYMVYGSSLIGFTHGDGAKDDDLSKLMAFEAGEHYGKAMRGYWIIKHMHHKMKKAVGLSPGMVEKDDIGVTIIRPGAEDLRRNVSVEVVRSPSGTDGWHDRNGYVGAIKAIEAFLFHYRDGQVARFTKPFW